MSNEGTKLDINLPTISTNSHGLKNRKMEY
jgi:hypothetical protein